MRRASRALIQISHAQSIFEFQEQCPVYSVEGLTATPTIAVTFSAVE